MVYFDVSRYTSMQIPSVFGLIRFLSMLENFLEARRISGVCITCMNKCNTRTRYRHVEYALNVLHFMRKI